MNRKQTREEAFKILYQTDIQKCSVDEILNTYFSENTVTGESREYIEDVTHGVYNNLDGIDDIISKALKSWTLKRISKVDKAALRLAMYEIIYRDDIPQRASIFEAVDIVKKYNSNKAGGFVNGILRSILRTTGNEESVGEE